MKEVVIATVQKPEPLPRVFQELQEMIEKHRSKNEAWLRARAEENDRERRELCSLRVSKHVTSGFFFFHFLRSCCERLRQRDAATQRLFPQEEVLAEQERLEEEQSLVQARSKHLLSIMQQFKGL